MAPVADTKAAPGRRDERKAVRLHRYHEARSAGLTRVEARLFAESEEDVGLLRKLLAGGATPQQIAAILL